MTRGAQTRSKLRHTGWRVWLTIAVLCIPVAVIVGWAIDYATLDGDVSRNVTIEDIHIGRMHGPELQRALAEADAIYGTGKVDFVIRGEVITLNAADIGLTLDEQGTLDAARSVGRDDPALLKPVYWAASFFKKRHAPVRVRLDEAQLTTALADLPGQTPAREPRVVGTPDSIGLRGGKSGLGFKVDEVARRVARVARDGTLPIRVRLELGRVDPRVSDDTAKLLAFLAHELTQEPITVTAPKGSMEVIPSLLRSWITSQVVPGTDEIELIIDVDRARKSLVAELGSVQHSAVDAAFTVEDSKVRVISGVDGKKCCSDKLGEVILDALQERRDADEPEDDLEVALPLDRLEPDFTTDDAKKLGITSLLGKTSDLPEDGEATTPGSPKGGGPVVAIPDTTGVVANIDEAIKALRGRIILPEESLSLNEILGPPSEDNGYVSAAMDTADGPTWISGGGTDLVAAALFRAAYEGGLDIPESTNHGIALPGVPPGIEATLGWTDPDLVVSNPSEHAVLVWIDRTSRGVRVQLFSTRFTKLVSTTTDERRYGPEKQCLEVTVTRERTFRDDTTDTDKFKARYTPPPGARDDPDRVVCPGR